MKHGLCASFAIILGVLMVCVPLFAHHGASAYDMTRSVTFEATVTQFDFVNPHSAIYFDSKDANGNVMHWACEMNAPPRLIRGGWTRNTLKTGDHITIIAHPNKRENARVVFFMKVILPDGQELLNEPPE